MKKMIIYSLREKSNAERSKIIQTLFGYLDKSNKGKYMYKRKGLFDNLNYKKEMKNILYFNTDADRKKAINILKKLKLKFLLANS